MFASVSSQSRPKMADLIFSTFSSEHTVTLPEDKFFETFVRLHGFQPSSEVLEQKLFLNFDRNERLIKLKVEREDICVFSKKCEDPQCELLHNIRKMDYCRSFTSFDGCPRKNECQFLHVPSMRLCDRVVSVFGWRGSQNMSEADFIDQHARVYPYDHQPVVSLLPLRLPFIRLDRRGNECEVYLEIDLDRDICKSWLSNCCSLKRSCRYLHPKYYCREFAAHKTCRKFPHCPFWHIAGKFISPPPSRSETTPRLILTEPSNGAMNPHLGHESVVLTNLDERWEDDALISDIREMFVSNGFKVVDIFMRGRIRLAFVQLGSEEECKVCIKELDDSWCYNRIVRVERAHRGENRICIKTLNSEVVDVEVKHWLEPFNLRVQRVCIEEKFSFGSNIAFIFLKDQQECERAIALLHQRGKLRGRTIGVEHPRSVPLIHQLPLRHTHEPEGWSNAQHKQERDQFDEFDTRSNTRKKRTLRNPANVQTSHPSFRNSRLRKEIRRRDGASSGKPSSVMSSNSPDLAWNMFMPEDENNSAYLRSAGAMDQAKMFGGGYEGENEYSQPFCFTPTPPELSPSNDDAEAKQNFWFESESVNGSVPELPSDRPDMSSFWSGYMYAIAQQQKMGGQVDPSRLWHPASVPTDSHRLWQQQQQQQQLHVQDAKTMFGGFGQVKSNPSVPMHHQQMSVPQSRYGAASGQYSGYPMEMMSSASVAYPPTGNAVFAPNNNNQGHLQVQGQYEFNFDPMNVEEYAMDDVKPSGSLGFNPQMNAQSAAMMGFVGNAAFHVSTPLTEASDIEMEETLQGCATSTIPLVDNGNMSPRDQYPHPFYHG